MNTNNQQTVYISIDIKPWFIKHNSNYLDVWWDNETWNRIIQTSYDRLGIWKKFWKTWHFWDFRRYVKIDVSGQKQKLKIPKNRTPPYIYMATYSKQKNKISRDRISDKCYHVDDNNILIEESCFPGEHMMHAGQPGYITLLMTGYPPDQIHSFEDFSKNHDFVVVSKHWKRKILYKEQAEIFFMNCQMVGFMVKEQNQKCAMCSNSLYIVENYTKNFPPGFIISPIFGEMHPRDYEFNTGNWEVVCHRCHRKKGVEYGQLTSLARDLRNNDSHTTKRFWLGILLAFIFGLIL